MRGANDDGVGRGSNGGMGYEECDSIFNEHDLCCFNRVQHLCTTLFTLLVPVLDRENCLSITFSRLMSYLLKEHDKQWIGMSLMRFFYKHVIVT